MTNEKSRKERRRVERPTLPETLAALRAGQEAKVDSKVYYGLSGLSEAEVEEVEQLWQTLDTDYRRKLTRRMAEINEANVEFSYFGFGMMTLRDPDSEVREAAIDLLFEEESMVLMNRLIELAQWDDSTVVRAAAMSALGRFILGGELGDLPESETVRAQDIAVQFITSEDEDVDVRRRALEALSNSSHELVSEAIEEAYRGDERKMRVSAVFAMGRSYDEQWKPAVLRELGSNDPEMRYEAARAAGELEIDDSVPALARLAFDGDREIQEVAIWSLGEIGGASALRTLTTLASNAQKDGDKELFEAIEDAILNANIVNGDLEIPSLGRLDD